MEQVHYRMAELGDIPVLLELRREALEGFNEIYPPAIDNEPVLASCGSYLQEATQKGNCESVVAVVGDKVVACGSVCYYDLFATRTCPHGRFAYLMNIYTMPAWRRRGLAYEIVRQLVEMAQAHGAERIGLDATLEGRAVYEKLGFCTAPDEMELFFGG